MWVFTKNFPISLGGMEEASSECVKSRSSPEGMCPVDLGMAMSKTNASEPLATGKAFSL